jgi:hypothetical protein
VGRQTGREIHVTVDGSTFMFTGTEEFRVSCSQSDKSARQQCSVPGGRGPPERELTVAARTTPRKPDAPAISCGRNGLTATSAVAIKLWLPVGAPR